MRLLIIGFVSGAASGIVMGLVSHILFRLKVFKSSLLVVDGSFFFRALKLQRSAQLILAAGLLIHLVTSGVFGAIYVLASAFLGFSIITVGSLMVISLYTALLYLSMLFIALPVAGEGLLGKKSGSLAWLEQLILHIVFALLYYVCLRALLQ